MDMRTQLVLQNLAQVNAQLHLDLANARADLAIAQARVQELETEQPPEE